MSIQYWQLYAGSQPDDAIATIRKANRGLLNDVDPREWYLNTKSDDKSTWVYYPRNDWNMSTTNGIIFHLIHPSNTLGAEVDISAQATVIRYNSQENPITDEQMLINCSQYGNPERNSDPVVSLSFKVSLVVDA